MVHRRALAAALAVSLVVPASAGAVSRKIAIGNFQWSPHDVTINLNDTVEWFWIGPDLQHSVTGTSANATQYDSDPNRTPDHGPNDRFKLQFRTPGTFQFNCKLHQIVGGSVTVLSAPGDGAPSPDPDPKVNVDTTSPVVDEVSVIGKQRKGRTLKYTLDEDSTVTVDFEKKRGKKWVFVTTRKVSGHVGYNKVSVRGPFSPGTWRAYFRAADADNNQSRDAVARFSVR